MDNLTNNQIARINRRLAAIEEKVCTSRTEAEVQALGLHYRKNIRLNSLIESHVDIDLLEQDLTN
jgi:hypothetical protein